MRGGSGGVGAYLLSFGMVTTLPCLGDRWVIQRCPYVEVVGIRARAPVTCESSGVVTWWSYNSLLVRSPLWCAAGRPV